MATETEIQSKPIVTLRPSSANLYNKCVAAAHGGKDKFVINWEGRAATVGSALHEAAKALVLHQDVPHDEIKRKYALAASDERDLRMLIACVRKYIDEQLHAGGWSPNLVAEQRIEATYESQRAVYDLGGTMDVGGFSADGSVWGTIDWKTTRLEDADYAPQQMIYLWLAKEWIQQMLPPQRWPAYHQYHIVFVRDWTEEISEAYTADQLDIWLTDFIVRIESWNEREYRPGGHCLFCPRQADCPAVYALVTAMAKALGSDRFTGDAERASDDELIDLYSNAGLLVTLINNAKELLKALVVGRGGEIAGPNGVLATTYRPSYTIDPIKAWPLIDDVLTEQEKADACRLSRTALLEGVANHYPRGQKGKAQKAFWEQLCDAEAVEQNDSLVLGLKRAKLITETNFEI